MRRPTFFIHKSSFDLANDEAIRTAEWDTPPGVNPAVDAKRNRQALERQVEAWRSQERRTGEKVKRAASDTRKGALSTRKKLPENYTAAKTVDELILLRQHGLFYLAESELIGASSEAKRNQRPTVQGNFDYCNFEASVFANCVFQRDSSFVEASFKNCEFLLCHFNPNVKISGANLSGANFVGCSGLRLDENNISGTNFDSKSIDEWHKLSTSYGEASRVLNSMLVLLYFAPILLKALFFQYLGSVQNALPERMRDQLAQSYHLRKQNISNLVLGEEPWTFFWYLAVVLLVYQLSRLYLTWKIGPLADLQRATGITPPYYSYSYLIIIKYFVVVFGVFAWSSLIYGLYNFLVETVLWP